MGSGIKKNTPNKHKENFVDSRNSRSSTAIKKRPEGNYFIEDNYIVEAPGENADLAATLDKMALENMMDDVIKRKKAQFKYEIHWNKELLPKDSNISKQLLCPYKAITGSSQAAKGIDKGARSSVCSEKKTPDSVGKRLCRSNYYKENSESKKGMRNTYLDEKGVYETIINRRKSWSRVIKFKND